MLDLMMRALLKLVVFVMFACIAVLVFYLGSLLLPHLFRPNVVGTWQSSSLNPYNGDVSSYIVDFKGENGKESANCGEIEITAIIDKSGYYNHYKGEAKIKGLWTYDGFLSDDIKVSFFPESFITTGNFDQSSVYSRFSDFDRNEDIRLKNGILSFEVDYHEMNLHRIDISE